MKIEHWHSGVPPEADQVSARPLAWKAASLIEKETLKKRISNIE
jgi:hypothetical protein